MKTHKSSASKLGVTSIVIGVLLASAATAYASAESSIKAAYVYNFAKLTTWPSDGDIVIGIIGSSESGDTIKKVVDGKSVGSHTISVKSIGAGDAKSCQIVFVCGGGGAPSLGGAHVLTVGEGDGFASNGGAIGFVAADGRVRFEISNKALKKAGLKISDKLEAIGKVVD